MVQPFDRSRWLSIYPPSVVDDEVRERGNNRDTQLATQMAGGENDYLEGRPDIGRAMGSGVRELFVTTDAAEALLQQFAHLQPRFIAVHDVAINTSRKLLGGVAAASSRAVQRLVIRRQGYGTTLASIEFVDCPAENGGAPVRIYSTDADADSATRHALARVLLGHCTLGVVMVGDLPQHALAEQLQPLKQHFFAGSWHCHRLQFMPLFPSNALPAHVGDLTAGTGIEAQVTPQVTRPADAWQFVSTAWNAAQGDVPDGERSLLSRLTSPAAAAPAPAAASVPAAGRPAAAAPAAASQSPAAQPGAPSAARQPLPPNASAGSAPADPLQRFLLTLSTLPGVSGCCLFDVGSSRVIAQGGTAAPVELARRGTTLLASADAARRMLGLQAGADEVIVMGGAQCLAVRRLASRPDLAVHLVFTPTRADWPALRPQLMALDATLR